MIKTEWDYTKLADAYIKRPNYSEEAIDEMLAVAGLNSTGGGLFVTLAQVLHI